MTIFNNNSKHVFNKTSEYKSHFKQINKKVSEFVIFFSGKIDRSGKGEIVVINGKQMQINNVYVKEFNAGYQTWLENKFIGDGVNLLKKIVK